jgi:hypothetical protein
MKITDDITKEEIRELIINHRLVLSDVIDEVIEINGFIGVGIISLSEDVAKYIMTKL